MNQLRFGARLRLLAPALALCTVALVAACTPPPAAPTATSAPTTSAPEPTAALPAAAAVSDKEYSQDPAPSAAVSPAASKTRHFMGDPNASVVVIEISDFQ